MRPEPRSTGPTGLVTAVLGSLSTPSLPELFEPQHINELSSMRAHVWSVAPTTMLLTVVSIAATRDANDARTTRLTCAIPRCFLGPALNCARLVLEGRRGARPSGFTEWGEDDMNRVRRGSSKSMRVRSGRGARCVLPLGGYRRVNLKKGLSKLTEEGAKRRGR